VLCCILFYHLTRIITVVQIESVSLFCITLKFHTFDIFAIVDLQIIFCTCVGFEVLTVVAVNKSHDQIFLTFSQLQVC
jgi:hypothetical protein